MPEPVHVPHSRRSRAQHRMIRTATTRRARSEIASVPLPRDLRRDWRDGSTTPVSSNFTDVKLLPTIEPDRITPGILRACREIVPGEPPIFVPVESKSGALPNKCILNVLESTRRAGGEIVMGWKVYLWPRVLVHLIGHAILRRDE